jgi:Putative transposase
MTLSPADFMRRFLLHVLPDGFQRIRHYGFLANGTRQAKLARIRQLLPPAPQQQVVPAATQDTVTATTAPEDPAISVTEDAWQRALRCDSGSICANRPFHPRAASSQRLPPYKETALPYRYASHQPYPGLQGPASARLNTHQSP